MSGSGLQYHITGHIDIAYDGLIRSREALFGLQAKLTDSKGNKSSLDQLAWTLDLETFGQTFERVRALKGNEDDKGINHSALVKHTQEAVSNGAGADLTDALLELSLGYDVGGNEVTVKSLCEDTSLGGKQGSKSVMPLVHLCVLWSFIMPSYTDESEAAASEGEAT